jgi:hypothetical protein
MERREDLLAVRQIPARIIGQASDQVPKRRQCNCKRSNCLKLYCECFATGIYCGPGCNCVMCYNNLTYEKARREACESTLDRNANAFRPKIQDGTQSGGGALTGAVRHNKGCQCKKSYCLKKYCECFQANIFCTKKCRCKDCKNFDGNEERRMVSGRADPFAEWPIDFASTDLEAQHFLSARAQNERTHRHRRPLRRLLPQQSSTRKKTRKRRQHQPQLRRPAVAVVVVVVVVVVVAVAVAAAAASAVLPPHPPRP